MLNERAQISNKPALFEKACPFSVLFLKSILAIADPDLPAVKGSVAFLPLIAVVALNGLSAQVNTRGCKYYDERQSGK
jgi:hypothetical protein